MLFGCGTLAAVGLIYLSLRKKGPRFIIIILFPLNYEFYRQDLAYIVRRRGYKLIKEHLATSVNTKTVVDDMTGKVDKAAAVNTNQQVTIIFRMCIVSLS